MGHTVRFSRVLEAFDLGRKPTEDLIAVLGEADTVRPVRWYYCKCNWVTTSGKRGHTWEWLPNPKDSPAPEECRGAFDGNVYSWKYDDYYWPKPY